MRGWPAFAYLLLAATPLLAPPAARAAEDCSPAHDLAAGRAAPLLMEVRRGPPRVHLETAPGAAARPLPAYLVPGDPVVVTSIAGGSGCAGFTGPAPGYAAGAGWLPLRGLGAEPPGPPNWVGDWRAAAEREVRIASRPDGALAIAVVGHPPGPVGSLPDDAVVRGGGDALAFAIGPAGQPHGATPCHVRLWRLGPYLVLSGDGCGLAGAAGIYRRAHPPA